MKVLVFDTETTGLPKKGSSIYEHNNWPYIIQISYILYDFSTNDVLIKDNYIKLNNTIEISEESYNIHGINHEILNEKGIHIIPALKELNETINRADLIVGHNISFDKRLVIVECLRNKIPQNFTTFKNNIKIHKPEFCTMKNTKELCNIIKLSNTNRIYLKYPSLIELYIKLFPNDKLPKDLHNSLVDILITLKCYIKINHNKNITEINDKIKKLFVKYDFL